jgi:hypothetical protein
VKNVTEPANAAVMFVVGLAKCNNQSDAPNKQPSHAARGTQMRTPDQYRELAAWCYRLAQQAKTEEHQKILPEMGRAWGEVAEELETRLLSKDEARRIRSYCRSRNFVKRRG